MYVLFTKHTQHLLPPLAPPPKTQYYPVEISRTRIITHVWPINGISPLLLIDCFCCLQRWTDIRDKEPIRYGDEWTFLRQGIIHGAQEE